MTEKKKSRKKQSAIPKKPKPVTPVGGGQGGFLTGPGNGIGVGR